MEGLQPFMPVAATAHSTSRRALLRCTKPADWSTASAVHGIHTHAPAAPPRPTVRLAHRDRRIARDQLGRQGPVPRVGACHSLSTPRLRRSWTAARPAATASCSKRPRGRSSPPLQGSRSRWPTRRWRPTSPTQLSRSGTASAPHLGTDPERDASPTSLGAGSSTKLVPGDQPRVAACGWGPGIDFGFGVSALVRGCGTTLPGTRAPLRKEAAMSMNAGLLGCV